MPVVAKVVNVDDDTVSINVLLQIAQILVLKLPFGNMQIVGSKWMKKFLITEDKDKVDEYLPLFILTLKQKTLVEPFNYAPLTMNKKWDNFYNEEKVYTLNDIKKSIKEDRISLMHAPPYKIDISRDLTEYAAYQEIPKFGAHFYYAFSLEPLPNWQNFNKFKVPKRLIPTLTVEYTDYEEKLEDPVLETPESVETVTGSITASHVVFDPLIIQSVEGIPPVLERLLETLTDESVQIELEKTTQELERLDRLKGIPERLHRYVKDSPSTSSPSSTSTPVIIKTPATKKDIDVNQDQLIEDRVNEKIKRISLASQSPMCSIRAQELKTKLQAIKSKKEEPLVIPEVVIEPIPMEQIEIYQLPPEFLEASENIRSVAQLATTEIERLKTNQTPDLITSDFIVEATDNVGHQFLNALHKTDQHVDLKNAAIIAIEILDVTLDNRNLIQMVAGSANIVDSEITHQLEEIRENIATTEQQMEASDEIMDEPITAEVQSANKSKILDKILKAIVICEEDQALLDRLIPEDESTAKYVELLTKNNNASIEELENVQDLLLIDFGTHLPTTLQSTDQTDIHNAAKTAIEILDVTLDTRNLIQMKAGSGDIVDSEITHQLEEIRENIATTEQQIEADENMNYPLTAEEKNANKSQFVDKILKAIVICEEDQALLDRLIPDDESTAKYVKLLFKNTDAAIEELTSVQNIVLKDVETKDILNEDLLIENNKKQYLLFSSIRKILKVIKRTEHVCLQAAEKLDYKLIENNDKFLVYLNSKKKSFEKLEDEYDATSLCFRKFMHTTILCVEKFSSYINAISRTDFGIDNFIKFLSDSRIKIDDEIILFKKRYFKIIKRRYHENQLNFADYNPEHNKEYFDFINFLKKNHMVVPDMK